MALARQGESLNSVTRSDRASDRSTATATSVSERLPLARRIPEDGSRRQTAVTRMTPHLPGPELQRQVPPLWIVASASGESKSCAHRPVSLPIMWSFGRRRLHLRFTSAGFRGRSAWGRGRRARPDRAWTSEATSCAGKRHPLHAGGTRRICYHGREAVRLRDASPHRATAGTERSEVSVENPQDPSSRTDRRAGHGGR